MALLVCAFVSLGEYHLRGQMKPTHNEKGQILMCSASDYKSPVTSWQFCFVALGGLFHAYESNSAEPVIFCHLLAYLLSAFFLLHPLETTRRDLGLSSVWISHWQCPSSQNHSIFPKGDHQMLKSVINEQCVVRLCLGLPMCPCKNVNRGAATLPRSDGQDFKSSNKARQRQETLLLPLNSWYLQEDGFSL